MSVIATKNSMQDLSFAEGYVDFMARRGTTPEQRARAQIVQATIVLLDRTHPGWRAELLTALNDAPVARDIADIFPIPDNVGNSLLNQYIKIARKG